MNHNAWTNGTLLDIDSLGAGGSKHHLIIANTQTKLGNLMTNSELVDLIDSIGNYEQANGLQRNEPIKVFQDEERRLDNGGKYNYHVMQDFVENTLSYMDFIEWGYPVFVNEAQQPYQKKESKN
jgi:hypothetical protein